MAHPLAQTLVDTLTAQNMTVTCAESCTGGLIASAITNIPGSSRVFESGIVAYADRIKHQLLKVPNDMLAQHGAVSRPVVEAMAKGALTLSKADIAIATSGIAGPDGGSDEKPVGLVWFGLATRENTTSESHTFDGDREAVRTQAVEKALELLIQGLEGIPKPSSD